MQRFSVLSVLAALLTAIFLSLLTGCGGGTSTKTPVVASIVLTPATISLNEGGVATLSAVAQNSAGATIAADITFASSNSNIATVSSGGLVCGGVWDANIINCNATIGQGGVGQATITATSGTVTATATVHVHLQVDRVVVNPPSVNPLSGCTSMGQTVNPCCTTMGQEVPVSASDSMCTTQSATSYTYCAFSTSAPGCSPASPCDITSTVGPITVASNDLAVVANSAGIEATYSAATTSPTYTSGGTITGSKGQTCNLSNFGIGGTSGIDPTYSPATNSPTYTSGGTITGSAGQTCSLSNFNGVSGATATVILTGTNTIASGTHLTVTAEGTGATTPPTTATLSNGTASCSGTATVITALTPISGVGLGVIGAAATVALTGTNTIASGTQLTVTASGYGATSPPTTATLSNGTAQCSGTANLITALNSAGVFTAEAPGSTTIFGSVSGVNSVSVPYTTCPAVTILVHDAGSSNTSFLLNPAGTQPLTADVYDSNNQYIRPTLTWGSSNTASATVATGTSGNNPATITAVAAGTASITAACSYPDCNINVPAQYSLNVVTATVSGGTTTNVYAASTNSTTLVPISTSTNTAGTAITLPNLPNSIIIDPAGNNLYLGSSSGLMTVNLASSTITTYFLNGTIVAISPDGRYLLVSDSVDGTVNYFNLSNQTVTYTSAGFTTTSSAYTPDSKYNEWVSGSQLAFGLQVSLSGMAPLGYTANALDISAQGGLTYITGSPNGINGIDVRSTCDQSQVEVPPPPPNSPTLIKAIPNGTGAVAVATDSPSLDVVSTPGTLGPGCPVPVPTPPITVASVDMGVGAFNARQLFFSSDSTRAWVITDLPELLTLILPSSTPFAIPYSGGATAYSGGVTLDGAQVYVGTSDGTVHRIDVNSQTDVQQIAVNLKDSNGNPVPPNLVYVQPH